MKIALFVEGSSDRDSLSILARRVRAGVGVVSRVLSRGDLLNPQKVLVYVREDILPQHRDTTKIILCVDWECTQESEASRIVKPLQAELNRIQRRPPAFYCSVIHATESWLAADEGGLCKYLNKSRVASSAIRRVRDACRPKPAMTSLFRTQGREFSNVRDNPRLAEILNPQEMIKNSTSFARFARLIEDP